MNINDIDKTEAHLIPLLIKMNDMGLETFTSGGNTRHIGFMPQNEDMFLKDILPQILKSRSWVRIKKVYNTERIGVQSKTARRQDKYGNHYYWCIGWEHPVDLEVLEDIFDKITQNRK